VSHGAQRQPARWLVQVHLLATPILPCGRRRTDDERVDVNGGSASPASHGRPGACACLVSYWQLRPGSDEMACVSGWDAFQVILVFRLRFPERSRRGHLRHHSSGPQARRVDIGDGVLGDALLLIARREDGGAVAGTHVVALAIARRRIVDLEEEFQQLAKAEPLRVEEISMASAWVP
jgi:hypothetical protein